MTARLKAHELRVRRNGRTILPGVSLEAGAGRFLGLVGPNGAGKSTLLLALAGLIRPASGTVALDGVDIALLPARTRAATIAVVEQVAEATTALTVREGVTLGRLPHAGRGLNDHTIVARAIAAVGLNAHADERWDRLSGGQRQRAHIARALAQQPTVLFLDEPTNHLDIEGRLAVLGIARRLADTGMTVVACLHDLDLAVEFVDDLVVLDRGVVAAQGPARTVLSRELLARVFRVQAEILSAGDRPIYRFREAS